MFSKFRTAWILLALAVAWQLALVDAPATTDSGTRVLSWNIYSDAFVRHPEQFQALLRRADADILLLDEVRPVADAGKLAIVLADLEPGAESEWHIEYGQSGGRQRDVIASRAPIEALPEFSRIIPYPEVAKHHILQAMSEWERGNSDLSMENGIPVNGALVYTGGRRLLVVIADLQCCGDGLDLGRPEHAVSIRYAGFSVVWASHTSCPGKHRHRH